MPVPLVSRFPWYVACCLAFAGPLFAANDPPIQLQELTSPGEASLEDRINVMLRDRFGMLWLGTNRGLLRFGFNGLRWYLPNPSEPNALISGDIKVLFEDRQGRFWVGTNGGLHLMNRHLGTFSRVQPIDASGELWKDRNIQVITEDPARRLWIGTKQGLFVLENDFIAQEGSDLELNRAWICAVIHDEKGGIWAATYDKGLFYKSSKAKAAWKPVAGDWPKRIQAIHRTEQGTWWLGASSGLYVASSDPKSSESSPALEQFLDERIESLAMDENGTLWIGLSNGIKRRKADGALTDITLEGVAESEEGFGVRDVHVDDQGFVWFSMNQGGVYFWNRFREHWIYRDFADWQVLAIEQDRDNRFWLGTKRGGLLRWDFQNDELQTFLESKAIRGLHKDAQKRLWIGSDSGLFLLENEKSEPRWIEAFPKRVWRMISTEDGQLWVGMDDGLWITEVNDPKEKSRIPWLEEAEGLHKATITAIERDTQGKLWIATYSHGLFVVDPQAKTWRSFHRQSEPALPSNEVVGLYLDREDNAWVCSVSGGLSRLSSDHQITTFRPSTGFPYQAVVSLAQDAQGRYWANSSEGLIGFNQDGKTISAFSSKDGVLIGNAAPGSFWVGENRLWFGGGNGILGFDPVSLPDPPKSPIMFSSFRTDGREIQQLVEPGKTIAIGESSGTFSLELAYMDPFPLFWGNWQYRRQSQKDTWVELKDPQLQLGRYLPMGGRDFIEFKGLDHNGRVSRIHLQVEFLPPWWRAWLPIWLIGAILLVVIFTYLLVSMAERRRRKKLIAEAQMALARQKLAEDRAAVAEKERQFEVKARQQHEIHMQVLQQHLEQVSTEMANDIHDGPLSELRGLKFHLTHIKKSVEDASTSERLKALNEQLLPSITQNLRKVCGELLLPSFEYGMVPEIEKYVENFQNQHRNLVVETDLQFGEDDLGVEGKRILYRIFRTLVKNVGDHAKASHLRIALVKNHRSVLLEIRDNGKGFSVNESYESLRANKHFGLYMVQFFTKGLGGTFSIQGEAGKGTTASVELPTVAS